MYSFARSKALIVLVACVLTLGACDRADKEVVPSLSRAADAGILRYVPADTPYVIANVEPLPDALMDKIEPRIDRLLRAYQTVLIETVKAKRAELEPGGEQSAEADRVGAVVEELASLLSIEGLESIGITRESRLALYGNGLLPVLRIGLSDGALFDAALARIEERAEYTLPVARIGDQPYRFFVAENAKLIVAVVDDQAVVSLVPANFDEAQLRLVLGLELPATSIAEAGTLGKMAAEFGFTRHQLGFIDVGRAVSRFTGGATGLDADLLALMEYDPAALSDVCREEIRAVAGVAPRVVVGYTALNEDRADNRLIVELRDDIAAELAALPAAVPGLGADQGGLVSFGLSMDFKAARSFYEARLDALEADPYECEYFADLQQGVGAGREALNRPLPPVVYDFRGFLAVVEELDGIDFASRTPPKSVDARILLAMNNAQGLVALASMFSPEVAQLNLKADGRPVRLESPQLQGVADEAYVALTDDAVAVSVGEGSAARLEPMLDAPVADRSPVFSMSLDAGRYYGLVGEAMAMARATPDEPASPELRAAMGDIMAVLAELYERLAVDVLFTARGLEIDSKVTIGE